MAVNVVGSRLLPENVSVYPEPIVNAPAPLTVATENVELPPTVNVYPEAIVSVPAPATVAIENVVFPAIVNV